jgi:hypothetical protein
MWWRIIWVTRAFAPVGDEARSRLLGLGGLPPNPSTIEVVGFTDIADLADTEGAGDFHRAFIGIFFQGYQQSSVWIGRAVIILSLTMCDPLEGQGTWVM